MSVTTAKPNAAALRALPRFAWSYNMVYLAHSVRPNFCLSAKTSDIPISLYELVLPPKKEYLKIQGELL